jgi:hypothetical protein
MGWPMYKLAILLLILSFPAVAHAQDQTPAMLVVVHESKMGKAFKLIELRYTLDGGKLYYKTTQDEKLELIQREEVFRGVIEPGRHNLHVHIVYQGQGYGVFSYLKGYKFTVKSKHKFWANPGQTITATVTGFERSVNVLAERPAVRWWVKKDPPDKKRTPDLGPNTVYYTPKRELPRFMAEMGFDFDYLFWADGGRFTWGWSGAFGVRLFDKLYLKAKVTLPMFFLFLSAGNHSSFGGELEYVITTPHGSDTGYAMSVKAGGAFNWHVNHHIQLFGPEVPEPSQCANGLKTWAAVRIGVGSRKFFSFLDVGLDVKHMEVKNRYATIHGQWFVGPYFGINAGGRF